MPSVACRFYFHSDIWLTKRIFSTFRISHTDTPRMISIVHSQENFWHLAYAAPMQRSIPSMTAFLHSRGHTQTRTQKSAVMNSAEFSEHLHMLENNAVQSIMERSIAYRKCILTWVEMHSRAELHIQDGKSLRIGSIFVTSSSDGSLRRCALRFSFSAVL